MKKPLCFTLLILAVAFFASCYPKKKILATYPDGKLKVVRHYKRSSWMNEKVVGYYENGKKEYIKYWKNDVVYFKTKSWYENGRVKSTESIGYKDTLRIVNYSPIDSVYHIVLKGLVKDCYKEWYETGKIKRESYPQDGEKVEINYKYNPDSIKRVMQPIKSIGYDSCYFSLYEKWDSPLHVTQLSSGSK